MGTYIPFDDLDKLQNATMTLIRRRGRLFGVTCKHVNVELRSEREVDQAPKLKTGQLLSGNLIINLSSWTSEGLKSLMLHTSDDAGADPDIAICDLTNLEWFFKEKGKKPIELDSWEEPKWSELYDGIAAGFPTEHKYFCGDTLKMSETCVVAGIESLFSHNDETFVLTSSLKQPHKMTFSGMSGGPIFAMKDEHQAIPVGILFQGDPSTSHRNEGLFAGPRDILIRAMTLTPERFEKWLSYAFQP